MNIVNYNKENVELLVKEYFNSIKHNDKNKYFEDFGCFDIEVSSTLKVKYGINYYTSKMVDNSIPKYGLPTKNDVNILNLPIMYIWQFQLGETTIIGRWWYEYKEFVDMIQKYSEGKGKYIVFVHNLNYEMAFLKYLFKIPAKNIFRRHKKTILNAVDGNIQYRCSYQLTGKSLDEFTKNVEHHKAVDNDYDYNKIRFPWTKLTDLEMEYCVNDVLGMREALIEFMKSRNVDLQTIRYTKTGFVKKRMSDAWVKESKEYKNGTFEFEQGLEDSYIGRINLPDYECYKAMKKAVRGGNTCVARNFRNVIVENVYSYDASKYYPSLLVQEQYPVGKWSKHEDIDYNDLLRFTKNGYAWFAEVIFDNIKLKDSNEPIPYIQKSQKITTSDLVNPKWYESVRLESAETLRITVTDIDMLVIQDMYDWDAMYLKHAYTSKYGYLPQYIRKVIKDLYMDIYKLDRDTLEYDLAKCDFNAVHGLCGTDRLETSYFDFETFVTDNGEKPVISEKSKAEYDKTLSYDCTSPAWYVWGTAWGRYRLQQLINQHRDRVVYVSVDSFKIIGETDLTEYNDFIFSRHHGVLTPDEEKEGKCIGQFRIEWIAKRFKALGLATYAREENSPIELSEEEIAFAKDLINQWENPICEEIDGIKVSKPRAKVVNDDLSKFNIVTTISGMDKKKGSIELYIRGGLDNFKEGFTFVGTPRKKSNQVCGDYKLKKDLKVVSKLDKEDLDNIKKYGIELLGGLVITNQNVFAVGVDPRDKMFEEDSIPMIMEGLNKMYAELQ